MSKRAKSKAKADESKSNQKGGKPATVRIPDEVRIKREPAQPETPITQSASVVGDQRLMVIDILNSVPCEIIVIDAQNLDPEKSGKIVFVESNVIHDVLTEHRARGKFAAKPDGTVIYNGRGFDEVRASAEYDLVDIVKLAEHLASGKSGKRSRSAKKSKSKK